MHCLFSPVEGTILLGCEQRGCLFSCAVKVFGTAHLVLLAIPTEEGSDALEGRRGTVVRTDDDWDLVFEHQQHNRKKRISGVGLRNGYCLLLT